MSINLTHTNDSILPDSGNLSVTGNLVVSSRLGVGVSAPTANLDVGGTNSSGYSLLLRSGDGSISTDSVQVAFGYNGTTEYRHSIRTRHNAGANVNNAIDFWLWESTQAAGTLGSKRVMTIDSDAGVLINTADPGAAPYGLILANGSITLDNTRGLWVKDNAGTPETVISVTSANNVGLSSPTLGGSFQINVRNISGQHQFLRQGAVFARFDSSNNLLLGTASSTFNNGSGLAVSRTGNATVRVEGASSVFELQQTSVGAFISEESNLPLIFRTNATERLRVGTDGTVSLTKAVYADPTSEDYFRIKFEDVGGINNDVGIGQPASGSISLNFNPVSSYFSIRAGTNNEVARFTSDTRLGIGITSPTSTLHVSGTANVTGNVTLSNTLTVVSTTGNVGVGTTSPSYKLQVNGSFAATTKSFVIAHPTKDNHTLVYGSLEGPENGVYVRGRLQNKDTIELPDYWSALVDENSITVQLTPIGKHQNLYVKEIGNNTITVGTTGLFKKSIDCFYIVNGERKDVPKLQVEVSK